MSSIGDISVAMGLDDAKWVAGVLKIQNTSAQLGQTVKRNLGGAGMAQTFQQAAFGASDFAAVLSMGGKNALGRALMSTANNVQMLGAAFGPWGMVATTAAATLGSILIPKLFEGETAFDAITRGIEESTKRMHDFIQSGTEMISFEARLGKMRSSAAVEGIADDLDVREKRAKFAADALARQRGAVDDQIKAEKKRRMESHDFLNPVVAMIDFFQGGGAHIEELEKQRKKLDEERRKIEDEQTMIAGQRKRAAARAEEVKIQEAEDRNNADLVQRSKDASRIRAEARSPFDIARQKIEEARNLMQSGTLEQGIGQQFVADTIAGFEKQQKSGLAHAMHRADMGTTAGSSADFSAIQASIREQKGAANAQVEKLTQQVDLLKRIAQATEKSGSAAPVAVGIGALGS
jgi:hypothetical protein